MKIIFTLKMENKLIKISKKPIKIKITILLKNIIKIFKKHSFLIKNNKKKE
jgi:hypothetical protein